LTRISDLWARFRRARLLTDLRSIEDDVSAQLQHWRRARVRAAAEVVQADRQIRLLEIDMRRTRIEIAKLEDPQRMLDEALARRTDVH
jgi:hypothetical protein